MPWDSRSFGTDKVFLLETIAHARKLTAQESAWDVFGYRPNAERIEYALDSFAELVEFMTAEKVSDDNLCEWLSDPFRKQDDPVLHGCTKCPKHGLIMSYFGCKLCNDLGDADKAAE